jgi:hypothetical protein
VLLSAASKLARSWQKGDNDSGLQFSRRVKDEIEGNNSDLEFENQDRIT